MSGHTDESEIVRLIDVLRSDEGDSVTILCDNPDFNGQPNCAIECCGDWTGWLHKRFAADSLLDTLSMEVTERKLPSPREVIAESNGHHWVKRFNLICCRDCGFIRRADDQNKPCKGPVGAGIRQDLAPEPINSHAELVKALEKILQLSKPGQTVSLTQAIDILTDIWNESGAALAKATPSRNQVERSA